jgi:hypothetical protein
MADGKAQPPDSIVSAVASGQTFAIHGDSGMTSPRSDKDDASKFVSWLDRHNVVLTIAVACVAPVLYLIFVDHFATGGLLFDDWGVLPFIHPALHGHFSFGQLWSQYGEPRLPLVRLDLLFFSTAFRFDTRWALFFSAAVLVAAYALLLALFRRYLGRPLTPIPVLIVGAIWFSLADTQSALLAFEVGWFLVVFGFIAMLFALIVPRSHRTFWLTAAIVAAVVATFGAIQGFAVWPIGAVCILWCQPGGRRRYIELAVWIGAFLVTTGVYLAGYKSSLTSCTPYLGCIPTSAVHHPFAALRFLVVLIGNVIPGAFTSSQPGEYLGPRPNSVVRFEIVGVVLSFAALFILVQSWRHRTTERIPLPLLLIGFSLLFDATITWGRLGEGPAGSVISNRYVLPNLVLLAGIVMYAWAHMPPIRVPSSEVGWKAYAAWASLLALAIILVVQVIVSTEVGLTAGRNTRVFENAGAQLVTNLNRVPVHYRECELAHYLIPVADVPDAAEDHLGEFNPTVYREYRKLGPPALLSACTSVP